MAKDEPAYERLAIEVSEDDDNSEVHIVGSRQHPAIVGKSAPIHSLCLGEFGMSRKIGSSDFDWSLDPLDTEDRVSDSLDRHYASTLTPMTTTIESYLDYLTLSFTAVADGDYKISTSYIWGFSSTSNNFRARLLVNNVTCWEHEQEPKDSRDQAILQSYPDLVLPLLAGTNEVKLQFATSKKKKQATITTAGITVERWSI